MTANTQGAFFRKAYENFASANLDFTEAGSQEYAISLLDFSSWTDAKVITAAVSGTAGAIRLTATAHGLAELAYVQTTQIPSGFSNANGTWQVHVVDANTIELLGSVFSGSGTMTGNSRVLPLDDINVIGDFPAGVVNSTTWRSANLTGKGVVLGKLTADNVNSYVPDATGTPTVHGVCLHRVDVPTPANEFAVAILCELAGLPAPLNGTGVSLSWTNGTIGQM